MGERLLTTLEITCGEHSAPLSPNSTLAGIEIWTNRSKIVNEHIRGLSGVVALHSVVSPLWTPLWAVIDKPYDVYTKNEDTQNTFQRLLDHSELTGGLSHCGLLVQLKEEVFLMFYIEVHHDTPSVKCLVLGLFISKIQVLVEKDTSTEGSFFIDEQHKEDLMDSLIHQRVNMFNNLSARRQIQLTVEETQARIKHIRHKLRSLITLEVKQRMREKPKATQSEVADMCFKAMSFRFRGVTSVSKDEELDMRKWIKTFLDVLNV